MNYFFELYRRLTVRTRIILLCVSYTFCITVAVGAGRSLPLYLAIASTATFSLLGAIFCALLFWSINDALKRILGYLSKMEEGDLTQSISAKRNNEISAIIRSIASLQKTMREIITQIAQSSEKVAAETCSVEFSAGQIAYSCPLWW